jgi:hypothetical protein
MAEDLDHLVEEIAVTVVHEFGHHVGIDDDRLHDLGWGLRRQRPARSELRRAVAGRVSRRV